jgi:hypothetical protein
LLASGLFAVPPPQTKAGQMPALKDLHLDDLEVALNAADALMKHKEFLPRAGLLLMLISRFRDDIRDAIGAEVERLPGRGQVFRSLDELTTTELAAVSGAVGSLLEDRFKSTMDDPALPMQLDEYRDKLNAQKTEREQLRAQVAS